MEIPDLTFQLNLTGVTDYAELARWFEAWSDLGIEWKTIGILGVTADNWIDIGYEYPNFPDKSRRIYHILVASRHNENPSERDFETQLAFARTLMARFEAKGCGVEFSGHFEDCL